MRPMRQPGSKRAAPQPLMIRGINVTILLSMLTLPISCPELGCDFVLGSRGDDSLVDGVGRTAKELRRRPQATPGANYTTWSFSMHHQYPVSHIPRVCVCLPGRYIPTSKSGADLLKTISRPNTFKRFWFYFKERKVHVFREGCRLQGI